jgi:lycopene cyclase domain-containing protein
MSLYFALLLLSVAVPFLLSFDKRLRFYKKWKYVLPSIFIVAAVYIAFDIYFTKLGVWGFNPQYLSGISLLHLPLEEWLFFIIIAYASLFLHFSIVEYFPNAKVGKKWTVRITILLFVLSIFMVFIFHDKMYTVYISLTTAVALALAYFDKSQTIASFYITFLVILIPFLIVNGILTGSFIESEVVWYNNDENLGIRFFTIPIEDFAYGFSLILYNLLLITGLKTQFNK